MLAALRRGAASLPAKILFGILIVSFAIWGVGDMFRGRFLESPAITIGSTRVSPEELQDLYQRQLDQMRRMLRGQFEPTEEMRRSLMQEAVERAINSRVMDQEAHAMGLAASTDMVRDTITRDPGFRGLDNRFNYAAFLDALRNAGMSEPYYVARMQEDLLRQQLGGTLRAGVTAPEMMARIAYIERNERRVAEFVTFRSADGPAPPAPAEDQLRRYHQNNAAAFQAPEYRKITVLTLGPAVLAARVTVNEEDLRTAFPDHRAAYDTPERREVDQIIAADEATAERLATAWRGGASWEAISAQAQAAGAQAVRLGLVARTEVPIQPLAEAIFATATGSVSAPVRSPLGYHVLRVNRIEAGHQVTFEEVKDRLRQDVARERAVDLVIETVNKVEDALAGGATIEAVARQFELPLRQIAAVNREGRDAAGNPVDPAPIGAQLFETAFTTEPGTNDNRLVEAPDNLFYLVRVDGVTPPALRPFETVKEQVQAAWTADQRRRAQETRAAQLLTELRGGKPLALASTERGLVVQRSAALLRQPEQGSSVPPELVRALFTLKQGEPTMVQTADGFLVASLAAIERPDPAAHPADVAQVRAALSTAMATDLERQFLAALRQRAGVQVNQTVVDNIVAPQ